MIPATVDPEQLVTLLTRQRDLYLSLRSLSEQQRGILDGDRPERLLEILRKRQDIVSSLSSLNEELGPYRRNWDAAYSRLAEPHRRAVADLHSEINTLLRVILKTDQEDSELLSVRKSAVRAQLADMSGSRAASAAYARTFPTDSSAAAISADIKG